MLADCVNPLALTHAWRDVAREAGVGLLEVEIVCSDARMHRARWKGGEDGSVCFFLIGGLCGNGI